MTADHVNRSQDKSLFGITLIAHEWLFQIIQGFLAPGSESDFLS